MVITTTIPTNMYASHKTPKVVLTVKVKQFSHQQSLQSLWNANHIRPCPGAIFIQHSPSSLWKHHSYGYATFLTFMMAKVTGQLRGKNWVKKGHFNAHMQLRFMVFVVYSHTFPILFKCQRFWVLPICWPLIWALHIILFCIFWTASSHCFFKWASFGL